MAFSKRTNFVLFVHVSQPDADRSDRCVAQWRRAVIRCSVSGVMVWEADLSPYGEPLWHWDGTKKYKEWNFPKMCHIMPHLFLSFWGFILVSALCCNGCIMFFLELSLKFILVSQVFCTKKNLWCLNSQGQPNSAEAAAATRSRKWSYQKLLRWVLDGPRIVRLQSVFFCVEFP